MAEVSRHHDRANGRALSYLPSLTSLRFVAAAMIVIHHTHEYFGYGTGLSQTLPLDQGVSFFFVLSGFILFYTHQGITLSAGTSRFIAARIARVWPLHFATLCLTMLFVPQPWGPEGAAFWPVLANIALVQAWIPLPGYFFSLNAVSWSLSAEMFFYLLFPALASDWRATWAWKVPLCACGAAVAVWLSGKLHLTFYDGRETVSIDAFVYINPVARVFEFSMGMLAASIWIVLHRHLARPGMMAATALEAGATVLTLFAMTHVRNLYAGAFHAGDVSPALLKWAVSAGTAPFFALLIAIFASGCGGISLLLSWAPFVRLGDISFAVYMSHQMLFRALTAHGTLVELGGVGVQYGVFWLALLGFSYALFRLVEQPCRGAVLRWLLQSQPEPATRTL